MEPVDLLEEGLRLRPWRPDDAEEVFRACQDPLIQRWTAVPVPYLREHAESFTSVQSAQAWQEGTGAPLGVFDAASGVLLGASGLVSIDQASGVGEVGYWTAPWARGRRVAERSARAVVRWALHILGLRRVVWRAEVGNHASRLVAARIGVRMEGVARAGLNGRAGWRDAWVGAVLAGELRETDAPADPGLQRAAARCRTFGGPQPTVQFATKNGESVRLRPLRSDDVPACVRACRDPDTVRYTTVPDPYDTVHAETFIHSLAPTGWARGTEAIFAIADADDALVGTMSLRLRGDELFTPTGDVGYLVGAWARGRGYASAALRALTDWGFAHLALRRIEWQAYVGNTASRATAQRAGFQIEGELRAALQHRGGFRDAWIGARIAPEGD
jgi:RimJ/RimL family protein N-acetyltransferase